MCMQNVLFNTFNILLLTSIDYGVYSSGYLDMLELNQTKVRYMFEVNQIVPDVIPEAPEEIACILDEDLNIIAMLGNEVTPTKVSKVPSVTWPAAPSCFFYTLAMIDPDTPSRTYPHERSMLHWLVGDIQGSPDKITGTVLADYIGPVPGPDTGLHRYVFLVYEQPNRLDNFDEPRINNTSKEGRLNFSMTSFAQKYGLGKPVFGNFYQARYDDYVAIALAQLRDDSLLPCLTKEIICS